VNHRHRHCDRHTATDAAHISARRRGRARHCFGLGRHGRRQRGDAIVTAIVHVQDVQRWHGECAVLQEECVACECFVLFLCDGHYKLQVGQTPGASKRPGITASTELRFALASRGARLMFLFFQDDNGSRLPLTSIVHSPSVVFALRGLTQSL
jgi:hypothetical protein